MKKGLLKITEEYKDAIVKFKEKKISEEKLKTVLSEFVEIKNYYNQLNYKYGIINEKLSINKELKKIKDNVL